MKKFFKKPSARLLIVSLIMLNLALFLGSSLYFSAASYQSSTDGVEVKDKDYLESGWRIVNWSLDMLKHFKDNTPKS